MATKKTVYSKNIAVFQNKIVDLYRGMSLDEKRMLVLLSPIVRTTGVKEGESVFLSASEYAKECNISATRAYEGLASASEKLVRRYFSYVPESGKKTVANWILRSTYSEGGVDVYFTEEVLTMLQVFDKYNPYTKYKKEIVLQLKGDYSFDLQQSKKITEFPNFDNRGGNPIKVKRTDFEKQEKLYRKDPVSFVTNSFSQGGAPAPPQSMGGGNRGGGGGFRMDSDFRKQMEDRLKEDVAKNNNPIEVSSK